MHPIQGFYLIGSGQVATLAGNKKPRIIATVEKLIWNTVFAVARGNVDLLKAVEILAESFPWLEVEAENQNDWVRHWFDGTGSARSESATGGSLSGHCLSVPPPGVGAFTERLGSEAGGEDIAIDHDVERSVDIDNGLGDKMDIGFSSATSSTVDGLRVSPPVSGTEIQPPTASPQTKSPASPLFTPHGTPGNVSPSQPLFLPDDDDDDDTPSLSHLVQQPLFLSDLPSKDYWVSDNHSKRHLIRATVWVSLEFTDGWKF